MDSGSFTVTTEGGLLTALGTPCHVSQAFDPEKGSSDCARIQFDAMWDTGCTKSVITHRVVEALGLKPIRKGFTQGVHGIEKSQAYAVNLFIPGNIIFHELTVIKTNPGDVWWDVLVGLDIISAGDFSVRNVSGNTEWSFSIPSGPLSRKGA